METVSTDEQIQSSLEALQLYQGNFLDRMASDPWVVPVSAYYHNRYVQILPRLLPLLMERGRQSKVVDLCRIATVVEPFHERIHFYLLRALLDLGEQQSALSLYKDFSDQLFDNLGILPAEDLRTLYFEAANPVTDRALPIEFIYEQLAPAGAMICEYDFSGSYATRQPTLWRTAALPPTDCS